VISSNNVLMRLFGSRREEVSRYKHMVAPCINNIKHLIVQLMHTNYKILRLLKWLKL